MKNHFGKLLLFSSLVILSLYPDSFYRLQNHEGNLVWSGTINLAWQEMREKFAKQAVELKPLTLAGENLVNYFNQSEFGWENLTPSNYYVKSGRGPAVISLINREVAQKFPNKTFPPLAVGLAPSDFIVYAYSFWNFRYLTSFSEKKVLFKKKPVAGFYAKNFKQKRNISIVNYVNEGKFILYLKLKQYQERVFLVKGYPTKMLLEEALKEISKTPEGISLSSLDVFEMPKIKLERTKKYSEIAGKKFNNETLKGYELKEMTERVKFSLDHQGVTLESEVAIENMESSVDDGRRVVRKLILNEPFWVILKANSSSLPYFILRVNNPKILLK